MQKSSKNQTISLPNLERMLKKKFTVLILLPTKCTINFSMMSSMFSTTRNDLPTISVGICDDDYRLSIICLFMHVLRRFAPKIRLVDSNSTVSWRRSDFIYSRVLHSRLGLIIYDHLVTNSHCAPKR